MMYNPLYGMLFRLLGEAAARSFSNGSDRPQNPYGNPYGYSTTPSDDSPIDVEAEVVDSDGKTQTERIHDEWDAKNKSKASQQLQGNVVFEGSRNYNILVGVLCGLLFLGGIVSRIYSLIMGNIFSSVIVPVALGAIFGLIFAVTGIMLIWRKGAWTLPFSAIDLLLVFFSAALMGYGNIIPAALAVLCCWAYMKIKSDNKLPFILPFFVVAVIEFILIRFPGLWIL